MGKYVWNESSLSWQERAPGARAKTLGFHEKLAMITMQLDAGVDVPLHTHEAEELGLVTKGKSEVQIGGENYVLGPGDYFFIPSNTLHAIRIVEDMEFIGAMSPPRPEYRPQEG